MRSSIKKKKKLVGVLKNKYCNQAYSFRVALKVASAILVLLKVLTALCVLSSSDIKRSCLNQLERCALEQHTSLGQGSDNWSVQPRYCGNPMHITTTKLSLVYFGVWMCRFGADSPTTSDSLSHLSTGSQLTMSIHRLLCSPEW